MQVRLRSSLALLSCLLALACLPAPAHAVEPPRPCDRVEATEPATPPPHPGPLPAAVALVPGVVVHGAGTWAAGDSESARALLAAEAAGVGAFLTGGAAVVLTGASRKVITVAAALTGVGLGVFLVTALADIYGASGAAALAAPPNLAPPALELSAGYRWMSDPLFKLDSIAGADVVGRFDAFRLETSMWAAPGADNLRYRYAAAWRPYGPSRRASQRVRDGSYIEVQGALTEHRFGPELFTTYTGEASVLGRLDLVRLGPAFGGSFAELGLGWGVAATRYRIDGVDVPADVSDMLLMRVGFGLYLGKPRAGDGEVQVFYDHRRDGYARGLPVPGIGGGVLGYVGARGYYYLDAHWGVGLETLAGSAVLAGANLQYRLGDSP